MLLSFCFYFVDIRYKPAPCRLILAENSSLNSPKLVLLQRSRTLHLPLIPSNSNLADILRGSARSLVLKNARYLSPVTGSSAIQHTPSVFLNNSLLLTLFCSICITSPLFSNDKVNSSL